MKINQISVLAGALAVAMISNAQTTDISPSSDKALAALEQQIKTKYPNTEFNAIRPSAVAGLVEVVMGQNIAYTDAEARYFVFGHLYDMKEQIDLTAQRLKEQQENQRITYPLLQLPHAIKTVKGDGSRAFAVFSDPNCPYCKKLESEIARLDNVTVYTFLYPVLGEDSTSLSIAIWCAPEPTTAWRELMLHQIRPALTSCVTPINDNITLGSGLGVNGTPTLIATDGRVLHGAVSAEKIQTWLGEVK